MRLGCDDSLRVSPAEGPERERRAEHGAVSHTSSSPQGYSVVSVWLYGERGSLQPHLQHNRPHHHKYCKHILQIYHIHTEQNLKINAETHTKAWMHARTLLRLISLFNHLRRWNSCREWDLAEKQQTVWKTQQPAVLCLTGFHRGHPALVFLSFCLSMWFDLPAALSFIL